MEWLPTDNQTLYSIAGGEKRSLELNTSSLTQRQVVINISPCSRDIHWAMYHGADERHLQLFKEHSGGDMTVFSIVVVPDTRYILQLSSTRGGSSVVSVRGEVTRLVRMRLRFRSRRRLSANWEPSPIDPQSTSYCVVASQRKNYTSLCAAQLDSKTNRLDKPNRYNLDRVDNDTRSDSVEMDNKIDSDFNIYEEQFQNVYRRKKFGRSTKATDGDPVIACVGDTTHHVIENLDPSSSYYVSVFGVARDRRAGSLLATGSVRPRTSTAKRLRENVPLRSDIRGKAVYYFKAALGSGGGVWMTVSICGGAVDVEVLVRGKRLYLAKNIEPHSKFFVPAPMPSSLQETSDEGSVQFDSSSEETKTRYVVRIVPCRSDRDGTVGVELTASTTRWGVNTPELLDDGSVVRELRPRRSCKTLDVAFLPATHNATDVIRYCVTARENPSVGSYVCSFQKKFPARTQCVNHLQRPQARVIVQKISGLKPGRKYAIQVIASNKGSAVPYKVLYADTNVSCKED
ncbi:protein NDNF-like isoform X2 [Pectinophora gossypiella]|nr:protein NDNF-like isoform X2 [Pectinophora gossypiella]XP_049876343.1 protein NDNF-like isoform X2 [Pectinophora gossypiella]